VELDPAVTNVARRFFGIGEGLRHRIHVEDGRRFLLRSGQVYDAILLDAYTTTRYGSSLPPHLTTKEFFELARAHLSTNGVLAYNVIGQIGGLDADLVGAIYRTLQEVFPQVYLFPARSSMNVVIVATRSPDYYNQTRVHLAGEELVKAGTVTMPGFTQRLAAFRSAPPPAAANSPVLTDDRSAIEALMRRATPR
jgi:spermidine synthase